MRLPAAYPLLVFTSPPPRARLPPPAPPPPPLQKVNEAVIWDLVVQNRSQAVLSVRDRDIKYPLIDQGKDLRGTPVALTLHWDVMPITGTLYTAQGGRHTVRLPERYCSVAEGGCALDAEGGGTPAAAVPAEAGQVGSMT